jgi:hypothetical protein
MSNFRLESNPARQVLGLALSVVLNSPVEEQKFGMFRM